MYGVGGREVAVLHTTCPWLEEMIRLGHARELTLLVLAARLMSQILVGQGDWFGACQHTVHECTPAAMQGLSSRVSRLRTALSPGHKLAVHMERR